ncbi:MAG: type I-MYXAN CRISPR-associated protein Cas6/Cmx6 [Gammaproteobacteria bacterium]|nr:type I-MYXAN CRISPR-associated protein Cas6/Cmx6 [Gammaproteobacteria bacterium]
MHWIEDEPAHGSVVSHRVQDLSFRIRARTLPLDHASVLSEAILEQLPWLTDEPGAGIHLIHYPQSGSGWTRQEDSPEEIFFVSGRARLKLRLPITRLPDASQLSGRTLDLGGHRLTVGRSSAFPLRRSATLFARRVVFDPDETEDIFVDRIAEVLGRAGITARKILCGQGKRLHRDTGPLSVRSVLLADLGAEESIRLQEMGLGPGRLYGCGLFIPHKSIASTGILD